MKQDLERLSKENAVRTWLLEGNSKLNDQMRGDQEPGVLSHEVIGQLTEYLNAHIGALYVRENGHQKLSGKYAFHVNGKEDHTLALGQGFVGQAAVDAKPILFTEVPEDLYQDTFAGKIRRRIEGAAGRTSAIKRRVARESIAAGGAKRKTGVYKNSD